MNRTVDVSIVTEEAEKTKLIVNLTVLQSREMLF